MYYVLYIPDVLVWIAVVTVVGGGWTVGRRWHVDSWCGAIRSCGYKKVMIFFIIFM